EQRDDTGINYWSRPPRPADTRSACHVLPGPSVDCRPRGGVSETAKKRDLQA
ncbi:hypothetical protein NDU88_010608, partial [Pleurodeles waltl]